MPRLIDADALKDSLCKSREGLWKVYDGLHFEIEQRLCSAQLTVFTENILRVKNAPTIDAEPVRHGRWEYRPGGWYCTACNKRAMVDAVGFAKYCCRCGAKMDGGDHHATD